MELKWLEDFVTLAAVRNFSRAADARGVTQPAFSRRVRTLEDWIGAALFVRSPQGVSLTAAGDELLRGADDLIRRTAQLRRDVREAGGRETASLRFAATHALSFTFFPRWMRDIERNGPTGAVRLISDSMQACEELMLQGQTQFMLCHHHPTTSGRCTESQFASAVVGHDALSPYVAPNDAGVPQWSLDESTGDLPLLIYSEESGLGRIMLSHRLFARAPRLTPVFSAHLAAALHGMARDGRGIAWLPATLAGQDLVEGLLVRAGGPAWDIPIEIRVFRPLATQSAAAEVFWRRVQ